MIHYLSSNHYSGANLLPSNQGWYPLRYGKFQSQGQSKVAFHSLLTQYFNQNSSLLINWAIKGFSKFKKVEKYWLLKLLIRKFYEFLQKLYDFIITAVFNESRPATFRSLICGFGVGIWLPSLSLLVGLGPS